MAFPAEIVQSVFHPIIRIYQSGRVERISRAKEVPASIDPCTSVSSRDITINLSTLLTVRLYLPPPSVISYMAGQPKLPIVIYYHGGGFCNHTPASYPYHTYLNSLVSMAKVVGISVGYRLAPEHPLPAAYDDSWEALLWVMKQSEKCIAEVGDVSRLFLAGESSGANIVHNMGMRLQENGMQVEGLVMVHPFFWDKDRKEGTVKKKYTGIFTIEVELIDAFWAVICPSSLGVDDPRLNPMSKKAGLSLARLGCRRIMVSVAEHDALRECGMAYYEKLKEDGWENELELYETKGEGHAFHISQRSNKNAAELMQRLVHFFNYNTQKMGKL